MKCQFVLHPDEVGVVRLYGELDHHEVEKVRSHLSSTILQGHIRTLIWNLESLHFMDSSGVGLVLGRMRELYAVDGQTILLNPSPTIERIFMYSGLGKHIYYSTEDRAIVEARGIVNG